MASINKLKMKFFSYNCYLFFFVFCIACAAQKHNSSTSEKIFTKDSLLAAIDRGACFGRCPEYKAIIYKSGFAEYYGRRNVDKIGYFNGQFSKADLKALINLIRANKLEEKDSTYINKYLADYPSWSLSVSDLKPIKTIIITHESPPLEIAEFGKAMDQYFSKIIWTKKSETNNQ